MSSFDNMYWQFIPTVDNSLAEEELSDVQMTPVLVQFICVTP